MSWLSIVLGVGPVSFVMVGAAARLATSRDRRVLSVRLTAIYAVAILTFFSGVGRGLSFRTEGGPTLAQLATVFAFFALALVALFGVGTDHLRIAAGALIPGFTIEIFADPIAAARGEVPLFFRRLRPLQMVIAVIGASILLAVA